MKATDLLIEQHKLVDSLFKKFEKADNGKKRSIFDQIAATLVGHDAIEREIFYPACEKALGKSDDALDESLVEHGLVEFSIFRADSCKDSTYFDSYVNVLKEVVQHHVKEEQDELLPEAKRAIDRDTLEALGEQMQARFDESQKEDWRKGLHANMKEVLSGKTKVGKTAPPPRVVKTSDKHHGKASSKKPQAVAHARSRKAPKTRAR